MFERFNLLVDDEILNRLKTSRVLIVGVGGVGGSALEAIVRLGVGNVTVIDKDVFDISNLNRQILSNMNNIGNSKANEAVLRAKSINPDILINCKEMFLNESNIEDINFNDYDYILDCCDTVTTKLLLIKYALKHNVKIVSAMGSGNRLDPSKVMLTDIWKTNYDPLAKIMRKLLRDNGIKNKIPVVTSSEIPKKVEGRIVGSCALVPNVSGFFMASFVFNDIMDVGK